MILMNDFERQWRDTREDVLAAVEAVGAGAWYILGKEVAAFEAELARRWQRAHCVGVASGLDAIEISLRILGCRAGDRVLTTPLSAFATSLAIVRLGAVPVFVDTDESGLLDLDLCRRRLNLGGVRWLLPVHLYGHAMDLEALRQLQAEYNLLVVEDCAQSIDACSAGAPTGSVGQIAAASFYPTKNLGAIGDGGALLTEDAELAARARCLRDYGQAGKYQHTEIGYNSRLDELQAAILRRAYLPRLGDWTGRRRAVAARYLAGIRHPGIRPLDTPRRSQSCWHLFPVHVHPERRADFRSWLQSQGITTAEHYPALIPDQPAIERHPHERFGDCPRARQIAQGEVSLPIHPYLTDEEVERVIEACNRWSM
jgi:dTDP-3-amino-3,4,6-trideoxy-alpha-D-glucose transaminase